MTIDEQIMEKVGQIEDIGNEINTLFAKKLEEAVAKYKNKWVVLKGSYGKGWNKGYCYDVTPTALGITHHSMLNRVSTPGIRFEVRQYDLGAASMSKSIYDREDLIELLTEEEIVKHKKLLEIDRRINIRANIVR